MSAVSGATLSGQAMKDRDRASDEAGVLAFATDADSELVLREGLSTESGVEVRRGGIADVARALQRSGSPHVLIVDISGVDQPLTALGELSQLVAPETRVLAVGDRQDLALYRSLTRGLGVLEYLFKPLTREMVSTHFAALIGGREISHAAGERVLRGGRLVTVTGVHGGVGATTIAANLAWVIAEIGKRHTILLDGDLYGGTAAMLLSAKPAPGLRAALESPDRIDDLFIKRTAQKLSERLHVLAGEGRLTEPPRVGESGAVWLVEALRRRFNVVICDASWPGDDIGRELFAAAHQRILVTEPSLLGARNLLRYLAVEPCATNPPVVVLNHVAKAGNLSATEFQRAVGRAPDLEIPHLNGALREAANLGEPAAARVPRLRVALEDVALRAASVGIAKPKRRWGRG